MIITGAERFKWADGYRVLSGYGHYSDEKNKGSPTCRSIELHSPDPEDAAAVAANAAIKRIIERIAP